MAIVAYIYGASANVWLDYDEMVLAIVYIFTINTWTRKPLFDFNMLPWLQSGLHIYKPGPLHMSNVICSVILVAYIQHRY